jgi:two-component system alkaline phosphatase synthesis response regulator PhoP
MEKDRKIRVLLVDDEVDILRIVKKALELRNFEVITAATGSEALVKIDSEIDIILLDIMLPDISGYDICQRLKNDEKLKDIPIIMLSAKTQMNDIKRGLDVGVDMYITKPFDPFNIADQLEDVLRRGGEKK